MRPHPRLHQVKSVFLCTRLSFLLPNRQFPTMDWYDTLYQEYGPQWLPLDCILRRDKRIDPNCGFTPITQDLIGMNGKNGVRLFFNWPRGEENKPRDNEE